MSYEGYEQCICENGHYRVIAASMYWHESTVCFFCKGKFAWYNSVNDTNCDESGKIAFDDLVRLFQITPEVVETCNLGHRHITSQAVFRIPKDDETRILRTY